MSEIEMYLIHEIEQAKRQDNKVNLKHFKKMYEKFKSKETIKNTKA